MEELGLDAIEVTTWFPHDQDAPFVLVRMTTEKAADLPAAIAHALRRCYITDEALANLAAQQAHPAADILNAALPDRGSIMSGDFGEILGFLHQACCALPGQAVGPKKWRLKQDRNAAAPHSDVVHLLLPHWPTASVEDEVWCSEVKAKSTASDFAPIKEAIEGCAKDRKSRLMRTLAWLKDCALVGKATSLTVDQIDRFLGAAIEHPQPTRRFRAVAVVCASLVDAELVDAPAEVDPQYVLVVISVPNLENVYQAAFAAARATVTAGEGAP